MKIKCTTERRVWASGSPLQLGEERDIPADEAKILIDAGFAENVDKRKDPGAGRKADSKPKPRRRSSTKGQPKAS